MKKNYIILLLLSLTTTQSYASSMDAFFQSNGKLYVVVGVLAIILTGIFLFLIRLDKNLTKIEHRIK